MIRVLSTKNLDFLLILLQYHFAKAQQDTWKTMGQGVESTTQMNPTDTVV